MIDHRRDQAIKAHERARSFQGGHCSAIGHDFRDVGNGLLQCSRCGTVIGQADEHTVEVRHDEGMGGLVAALLIVAGAFIGAAICLGAYYAKTGQLIP